MNLDQNVVRRTAAVLLLAGAFVAQLVGVSQLQKVVNATHGPAVLQADGPFPPPPPTPIKG